MYLCNVCGKPFSETAGTPFFGLKTPLKTVCTALQELAEGLGIRAVGIISIIRGNFYHRDVLSLSSSVNINKTNSHFGQRHREARAVPVCI